VVERRKYARIGTDEVISFSYLDRPDHLAVVRNLSVGGIQFEAIGCDINFGQVLRVTFNVEDRTIVAVGRVAWSTDIDPLTTEVGLEFIEIEPRDLEMLTEVVAAGDPI
jgi:hypothetical protein